MVLMDPVDTFVKGPMHIPRNVRGQVLVVKAEHETRTELRPICFDHDPRVTTVWHPGNHVGIGGGYDRNGAVANVLEGITGYFQSRGIPIVDVAPERAGVSTEWPVSESYVHGGGPRPGRALQPQPEATPAVEFEAHSR